MIVSRKKMAIIIAIGSVITVTSCKQNPLSPGTEFMPDMYRGPALETYGESAFFKDNLSSRKTVEGTVSRGSDPSSSFSYKNAIYQYANNIAGYDSAGVYLKNPLLATEQNIAEGKNLFSKFCDVCHGADGKGNGRLVEIGKFPSPGAFVPKLAMGLNEGKMYHSITYGKGLMGSHASQVSKEERWKLVLYINELIKQAGGNLAIAVDSTTTTNKAK
ncbi:MAG: cytochrome c [Chitinophagaceae bacterium]|nr:cytochrome c [Chitinophagaceae bacterium]